MIYSGHSLSFPRVAALIVSVLSTTAMSTGPSTYRFRGLTRRYVLIILQELWCSNIFRSANKVYLGLLVRKAGTGIFLIRQALWLGNCRLQFFQGFLMILYRVLELSDGLLVLGAYDGSPRVGNFLHNSLNCLSVGDTSVMPIWSGNHTKHHSNILKCKVWVNPSLQSSQI
jgi:hypothetical protein